MKTDWLIVGAGFTGATLAERIASQLGQRVCLIDRRDHIGGNAFDYHDKAGVIVHKYGPHVFHTDYQEVWEYLSRFTEWHEYTHHVLAAVDGRTVPIPFNLNTLHALLPAEAPELESKLVKQYGRGARIPVLELMKHPSHELRKLGEYVYENFFRGYTLKQWGVTPEKLSPTVTGRVPIVVSRDDRYFRDIYQAMPACGYNSLFQRMLDHPNITVLLNTEYRPERPNVQADRVIYTGPIDAYFGYMHGPLPYRSLRFELRTVQQQWWQKSAVVNYPNDYAFTRITEFKYFLSQDLPQTTIMKEYPLAHVPGKTEPYYPIPHGKNVELYRKYAAEAARLKPRLLFAGRLGEYRYYNMDEAVKRALELFESEVAR